MNHSQLTLDFLHAFAESKGIEFGQLISVEIGVDSFTYKFLDLQNKSINTIEELRPKRV